MKVKVIRSAPSIGQDGIEHLVGKVFTVIYKDEDGRVAIISPEFDGQIELNPEEYRRLHVKG